ncbi:MAG: homoserine kinase [Armatimonadota bacterium]|nr:homoserine kinase [Armatimonadota bacterium]MDR7401593.1 homoserine kinase [Armatimonadota bacterium]MDR7405058.1 homoserine kinase [Armatimonadota bacterium]MDR7436860.1 homoserine kinase [Armatimonadota bacterium]MDR7471599.1 homoserine kinase [Armatimonadota bacterium]
MRGAVTVRVPATIANVGPAFDVLGVAVTLHNVVRARLADTPVVEVVGEGAGVLPADATNLVYRAAVAVAEAAGRRAAFALRCENAIPPGRGLGSSAAAIVGGAVAANAILGEPLDRAGLLDLAWRMEGHPDNVAPALLGGAVLADGADGRLRWTRFVPAWDAALVVAIPDYPVATERARAVLPAAVPFRDAVYNVGRAAWLVAALLTGRTELLASAMEDRLHQPYRAELAPGAAEAREAARGAGAWGAAVCGSGPAVLAVAPREAAERVGRAMMRAFADCGHRAAYRQVDVDTQGATVMAQEADG